MRASWYNWLEVMWMSTKDLVLELIKSMPETVTLEDIMAELYFRLKVDSGLKDLDADRFLEHAEVKRRLSRWLS